MLRLQVAGADYFVLVIIRKPHFPGIILLDLRLRLYGDKRLFLAVISYQMLKALLGQIDLVVRVECRVPQRRNVVPGLELDYIFCALLFQNCLPRRADNGWGGPRFHRMIQLIHLNLPRHQMHRRYFTLLSLFYFWEDVHRRHRTLVLLQDVVWVRVHYRVYVRVALDLRQAFVLICFSTTIDPYKPLLIWRMRLIVTTLRQNGHVAGYGLDRRRVAVEALEAARVVARAQQHTVWPVTYLCPIHAHLVMLDCTTSGTSSIFIIHINNLLLRLKC